ncbi:MAG: hypothetical protein ABIP93_08240 [Gemmatimonadaceae bacterium]
MRFAAHIAHAALILSLLAAPASAQKPTAVDLAARARAGTLRTTGGTVTSLEDGRYRGARVEAASNTSGPVMVWLDDVSIGDGVIELDIRGKDEFQKSFPGIAFRSSTDSVTDAVYLRPFNFRATDTLRHQHAVQYVSLPAHDWDRLRKEYPEVYENPVSPEPDPNGWVHVRLVLAGKRISVYVSEGTEPDLVVEALNERTSGRLGLFNPGDFANLLVTPAARR